MSFYIGDEYLVDEWEILIENLLKFNKLTYYTINGVKYPVLLCLHCTYFFYILFLTGLSEVILVKIILIVQSIISTISVIIFLYMQNIF